MAKDYSDPTHKIFAIDQSAKQQEIFIVDEVPLTLKLDGFEIVTLMTLGNQPEELALGYLRNQGLIDKIEEIASIAVDWQNETVTYTGKRDRFTDVDCVRNRSSSCSWKM
jgi:FdhD protein